MRIAYATETFPPEINGAALSADRTVRHLRANGHEVQLIRPRQPGEAPRLDANEWRTRATRLPVYPSLRMGWIRQGALRAAWRRPGAAPDVVHVATPGPLGWAALGAARDLGIPVTADVRFGLYASCTHYVRDWLAPAMLGWLRRLHARADLNFVPTPSLARELASLGFERLQVLGRGVDSQAFTPARRDTELRHDWRAGPEHCVLLYVGRLAPDKNASLALQTFERLSARRPGLRMVVVGDGPQRAELELAHPRARFTGVLTGAALAGHYASADVLLFPGLNETFGNVVLEALASGLALAAFDSGAAAEHVTDGVNGSLARLPEGEGRLAPSLVAADVFLDAAARALDASAPDGPMREEARLCAAHIDWDGALRQFEQQLMHVASARNLATQQPALA